MFTGRKRQHPPPAPGPPLRPTLRNAFLGLPRQSVSRSSPGLPPEDALDLTLRLGLRDTDLFISVSIRLILEALRRLLE